ncbi:MAG: DUF4262 domain-containing protein [Acidimicrobiia bacterium]
MLRECHCVVCAGAAPRLWRVEVAAGYAFTLGLWHEFGHPEVVVFGADSTQLERWCVRVGEAVADGKVLRPDGLEDRILDDEVVVCPRPVLAGWHRHLFAAALDFYRGQPVPVVQLVRPDIGYPDQPRLFDRPDRQPEWARSPVPAGWPFALSPDALVSASVPVAFGDSPATVAVHDTDGEWEFTDDDQDGELTIVHAAHVLGRQRDLAVLADLPAGWEAHRIAPGAWTRAPLDDDDEA